ncbi:WRKY DNA-binding protein 4 [Striga asiatica]|uniref:WRKY DNA-binding protein 4 n=1 Tax=Striga asiatica TaxID=4170 RepID=A0A5A7RAJ6_STRAF|nr:WRKY DNA-binding protein 4 [Striga asiatica]
MMEIKEKDKIVIAKPVATRPRFSNFTKLPFSEVISGADNPSPPAAFAETPVTVIRPRTVRFRPTCNSSLGEAEPFGSAVDSNPSEEVPKSKSIANVVYKPIAKLVSKKTVALLANLLWTLIESEKPTIAYNNNNIAFSLKQVGGGSGIIPTQATTDICTQIQRPQNAERQINRTSSLDLPLQPEQNANAILQQNPKSNTNRPSQDGHSWRKYGQKQVKGSEYPRSYYKCTHPNCPVKKKVEETPDGRISEVVYKGDHNHSTNPREIKINPSFPNDESLGQPMNFPIINNNDPFEDTTCNNNNNNNSSVGTSNSSMGVSVSVSVDECESLEAECREIIKSKRMRRVNDLLKDSCMNEGGSSEPTTFVRNINSEGETIRDGFRWRKYGQKVVKGNMYPRSYYRCTIPKCNVKKYVERISDKPANFITTYEGRHNHAMPTEAANPEARTKNKKS